MASPCCQGVLPTTPKNYSRCFDTALLLLWSESNRHNFCSPQLPPRGFHPEAGAPLTEATYPLSHTTISWSRWSGFDTTISEGVMCLYGAQSSRRITYATPANSDEVGGESNPHITNQPRVPKGFYLCIPSVRNTPTPTNNANAYNANRPWTWCDPAPTFLNASSYLSNILEVSGSRITVIALFI